MKHGFAVAVPAGLAIWSLCAGCGTAPDGREEPSAPSRDAPMPATPVGVRQDDADLAPLRARVAELEAALAGARAAAADLPARDALARALETRAGPALARDVERLVLAGEAGSAVLLEFLAELDGQAEKLATLTHDSQLAYALLRVAVRQPDAAASCARFLLRAARERPLPALRRELYDRLPVFLRHHAGRYPELRRELEQDVLMQLEHPGEDAYRTLLLVRELDLKPPLEPLLRILGDPSMRLGHPLAIQHLGSRGDEGLEALARYVRGPMPASQPTLLAALQEIAALESRNDRGILASLQRASDPQLRWLAGVAHFSLERDQGSCPLALELLNGDHDPRLKRTFLLRLRSRNQPIFDQIAARLDALERVEVRDLVKQVAATADPHVQAAPGPLLPPRPALLPADARAGEEKS